jgi:hypothetical protein
MGAAETTAPSAPEHAMKGTVVVCLQQLVIAKFGRETWERILAHAGLEPATIVMPLADYEDATVLALVDATCAVTGLTKHQALEAYGEYWVTDYGRRVYGRYYVGCATAREFFQKLGEIHQIVTRSIPNAKPPTFQLDWTSDRCLRLHYASHRNLVDLVVAMARGVGRSFDEDLKVTKVAPNVVEVRFP